MTQYVINIGALPNDGTGDPLRTAFNEVNLNFNQVWATGLVGSNVSIANNTILTSNTNGNLILNPNGIGSVIANAHVLPDQTRVRNLGSNTLRWNTVYSQYLNIAGDASITGNLSVTGNIVYIGNLITDAKTIQLANTAGTANAANGSGITVGANDNIATLLFDSTSNTWTTNIGFSTGNLILVDDRIMDLYGPSITNADLISGSTSGLDIVPNGDANATVLFNTYGNILLQTSNTGSNVKTVRFGYDGNVNFPADINATGNLSGNYILGNGSQLTGINVSTNSISNGTSNVEIATANSNVTITTNGTYTWEYDTTGNLTLPSTNSINTPSGSNGNINFHPDGSGFVKISGAAPVLLNLVGDVANTLNRIEIDTFGNSNALGGTFTGTFRRGNLTSPLAVQRDDRLASFKGRGYNGSVMAAPTGQINIEAYDNWSVGNTPTRLSFYTTNYANGNPALNMRIDPDGNVSVYNGNINVQGGGYLFGNSVTGNSAAFIGVPGYTSLGTNVVAQFSGNANSYSQLNFENTSEGTQASGDFIITADNGDDSNNFIDLGIAGSNWDGTQDNSLGNNVGVNDGYLYVNGANLVLGTAITGGNVNTWKFGTTGTLTFPDNSGSGWPINQQRFGMGNIGAWLDGSWTIGEFSGNGVSGAVGIRIDPGIEGNTGINLPSQADSVTQPTQIYNTGGGNITLFTDYTGNTWTFDNTGALNVPNHGVIRQNGPVNIVATDYAQLEWVDSGNVNIPDPNASGGPKNWAYVDAGGFHVETNLNNGGNSYAWDFDNNGNFTTTANIVGGNVFAVSNFVGANVRTNLTDFNWSEFITGIATGATTVVTLANNVFGDPWSGQVTITGVTGTTEANDTWWYQAVDSNQFQLYTDSSLSTPVDSSAWGAYTGGGFAVTLNYGNIEINAQNITIRSDHGDYNNKIWRFTRDGQTIFPYQDIVRGDTGGGNITGYAMVMGDGTNEAIISTPNGNSTYNNSQRLVINPGKGADGTGGEGGDIYLWAGRGGDTDGNGGDVKIRGGYGPGNGSGGYIRIEAGDVPGTGTPGYSLVRGGDHNGGTGGYVQLLGGYGGDGNGGYISIEGGYGVGEGGDVTIAGGSSGQGGAHYGNVFVNTGGHQWQFNNNGNLNLASDGTLVGVTSFNDGHINWVGNSSGDGYGYTTMNLVPDDNVVDSYVILDPTAPNHIHIRAGGAQDNSSSQLYLGGENSYFKVDNGLNPNLYISANSNVWTFGTDGILTVPGEGIIQSVNDTVILQSVNGFGNFYSARLGTNGGLYFETSDYPNGWLSLTNNAGNANITAASGTAGGAGKNIYITAGSADQGDYYTTQGGDVNITGGLGAFNDGGGGGHGGNVNITAGLSADPAGVAGNVTIGSGNNYWQFLNNGNLYVPGQINGDNNGALVIDGAGYGNGYISLPASSFGGEQIVIVNDFSSGNGIRFQTNGGNLFFGNDGNLSIPGSMSSLGNVTAGNFIGGGSNVELVAGTYTFTFDNTGVATFPTIGGDEGGEIHLGVPTANTTLQNSVKIDVYQDRIRFFEGSANAKGAYIDLANCANSVATAIGYRDIPQITFSANATAAINAAGCHYYSTTAGNLALTLPDNSSVAFPTGATLTVVVNAAGNVLVNQGTGVTLYQAGASATGNRVVGAYGLATVMKVAANTWVISGTGVY